MLKDVAIGQSDSCCVTYYEALQAWRYKIRKGDAMYPQWGDYISDMYTALEDSLKQTFWRQKEYGRGFQSFNYEWICFGQIQ